MTANNPTWAKSPVSAICMICETPERWEIGARGRPAAESYPFLKRHTLGSVTVFRAGALGKAARLARPGP